MDNRMQLQDRDQMFGKGRVAENKTDVQRILICNTGAINLRHYTLRHLASERNATTDISADLLEAHAKGSCWGICS